MVQIWPSFFPIQQVGTVGAALLKRAVSRCFLRLTTIFQYGILFLTTRGLSGEGSYCILVTFHTLQYTTTLGFSLVGCTPCLHCQSTHQCGFKNRNNNLYDTRKMVKCQSKPLPNKE